jgi:hypothetical protein
MVFCLRWIQNSDRGNKPNPRSIVNIALSGSLVLQSIRTIREAIIERKTAAHVMMLWKYKPLDQGDALLPWVGPSIKGGKNVARKGRPGKKQRLCSGIETDGGDGKAERQNLKN